MLKWLYGFVLAMGCISPGPFCEAQPFDQPGAFETLDETKGLSHHLVYCLWQDRRGFIWAGTDYGLNRYDGIAFTRYFAQQGQKSAIPNNHVNRIAEDKDGNLWIGTNRGIGRYNPLTGESRHFFTHEKDRETFKDLGFHVFTDRKGNVWAGNGHFLFRYRPATESFTVYPMDGGQSTGNTRNYFLFDFLEDTKGRIWLATSYGVKQFDTATKRFKSYHFPEQNTRLVENAVTSLAETPDGNILAGTWGGGLLKYVPDSDAFEKLTALTGAYRHGIVLDIALKGNTIYLATGAGLLKGTFPQSLNAFTSNNWTMYRPYQASIPGGEVVFSLLPDRGNHLWMATNQNLVSFDLREPLFQHQSFSSTSQPQLIPNVLLRALPPAGRGSCWVGSNDLYLAHFTEKTISKISVAKFIRNSEGQVSIWDMAYGKKGIWLATTGGLLLFDPETQRVKKGYYHQPGNPDALPGERLWKVYEDRQERVWIASIRKGISLLNPRNGSIRNFFGDPDHEASLFNKTTTPFFEDKAGNIWFGSDNMLYVYHPQTDTFSTIPFLLPQKNKVILTGKPQPFYEDAQGNILLSCMEGIVAYNPVKKVFTPILVGIPFFNPTGDILHDSAGRFWFGTTNGLFRWDTSRKNVTRFTTLDGLKTNEMDACLVQLDNGLIAAGSSGTLSYFFPEKLFVKAAPPPIALTGLQINGRDTAVYFNPVPELPHQSTLMFSYAALNFDNAAGNQYRYMLKGSDKDWSNTTSNTSVTYAHLPAGTYTFRVMGSNSDGVWNTEPAEFTFRIKAPFYLSGWFILGSLALLAAGLFLFYRYRLAQALKVERLRTRLATDLHDDVGATLSAIAMYSDSLAKQVEQPQLARLLGKIGEDSREMVLTMSDLVWAINPKNDGSEKMMQRMENYARDLCASRNVSLLFTGPEKSATHPIPMEARRNIFLIFKEALNNAMKYAACTQIDISIGMDERKLTLRITDNGRGFDVAGRETGNGLLNMKARAAECKGHLRIITAEGEGCTILLECPL